MTPTPCNIQGQTTPLQMYILNIDNEAFRFCGVWMVEQAREMWTRIAGLDANQCLWGFEVRDNQGNCVYKGSYGTDEC